MARTDTAVRYSIDGDPKVALRAEGGASLVAAATVAEAAKTLDALVAYWNAGDIPHQELDIVAIISEANTAGDGVYTLAVEVDTTAAFAAPVTVLSQDVTAAGLGVVVFPLDVDTVLKLAPGAKFIRISSTVAGTVSLAFNYSAYLTEEG